MFSLARFVIVFFAFYFAIPMFFGGQILGGVMIVAMGVMFYISAVILENNHKKSENG